MPPLMLCKSLGRNLRDEQEKHPTQGGLERVLLGGSPLKSALAYLNGRREFTPSSQPGYVSRGGFSFKRDLEEKRINLAENLIRRTDPGPFEDPNYLALLAYQAASLEMAFPDGVEGGKVGWDWSKFLLGTIHKRDAWAFSTTRETSDGYTVVMIYSGLIDFAYQAAKAAITAFHPVWSAGRSQMEEFNEERFKEELKNNPEPINRLYGTLEEYFFVSGYPRKFANESVPPEQQMPLSVLIGMTERWMIAHEYGHGLASRYGFAAKAAHRDNPKRDEEYFADNQATILTVISASKLDGFPPELSLSGPAFALACQEVLRQAQSIVRPGSVSPDTGDSAHPANVLRMQNVIATFDGFFERTPDGAGGSDLNFVLRPPDWKPVDWRRHDNFTREFGVGQRRCSRFGRTCARDCRRTLQISGLYIPRGVS